MLVYLYEKDNVDDLLKLNVFNKQDLLKTFAKPKEEEIDVEEILNNVKIEKKEIDKINKLLEYEYKYKIATTIPTMTSVTKIKQMKEEQENNKETDNNKTIKTKINQETTEYTNNMEKVYQSITENEVKDNVEKSNINENIEEISETTTIFNKPKFLRKDEKEKLTGAQKEHWYIYVCRD